MMSSVNGVMGQRGAVTTRYASHVSYPTGLSRIDHLALLTFPTTALQARQSAMAARAKRRAHREAAKSVQILPVIPQEPKAMPAKPDQIIDLQTAAVMTSGQELFHQFKRAMIWGHDKKKHAGYVMAMKYHSYDAKENHLIIEAASDMPLDLRTDAVERLHTLTNRPVLLDVKVIGQKAVYEQVRGAMPQ